MLQNPASRVLKIGYKSEKWQQSHNLVMTSSLNFFDVVLFLLSVLVTGLSFMSIRVLEVSRFSFIRDLPEIWKSEIPQSELSPISGDWAELGLPNLTQMSVMKCYLVLQNARVIALTVSKIVKLQLQLTYD